MRRDQKLNTSNMIHNYYKVDIFIEILDLARVWGDRKNSYKLTMKRRNRKNSLRRNYKYLQYFPIRKQWSFHR